MEKIMEEREEVECPVCGGSGYTECPECGTEEQVYCDECEGSGTIDNTEEDDEEATEESST
jgi:DnaJ-class molecular chaperone